MSTKVDLHELADTTRDYGFAYLLTVTDDQRTRAVAVTPSAGPEGLTFTDGLGRGTRANLAVRPDATLLWPPADAAGYTLIADGRVTVTDDVATFVAQHAVLHRPADHGASAGDCGQRLRPGGRGVSEPVRWVSAFLDVPADAIEAEVAFWSTVTGSVLGEPSGEDDEFLPLEPSVGDPCLWLQRIEDGPVGCHPDLYVDDVTAAADHAVGSGATQILVKEGLVVLRSPGLLPFCLVKHRGQSVRPEPVGPSGARAVVDQVCLDIPASRYDDECEFWATLTGWTHSRGAVDDEFTRLVRPTEIPYAFLLQRLDDEQPAVTAHLDLACEDRDAVAARHQELGADVVRRTPEWTVLHDPAGVAYCATTRRPGGSVSIEVRTATKADWPQIWSIFEATVRAGETYTYDAAMTSAVARELWLAKPPRATVVAETAGVVLGTATMGPNREGRGAHMGTASFMVAPEAQGHGVGRALGEHVVDWHRAQGFRGIVFNAVVETNTAAVALWTSLGFSVVGTVPGAFEHPVHGFVGLHVMHLSLV